MVGEYDLNKAQAPGGHSRRERSRYAHGRLSMLLFHTSRLLTSLQWLGSELMLPLVTMQSLTSKHTSEIKSAHCSEFCHVFKKKVVPGTFFKENET